MPVRIRIFCCLFLTAALVTAIPARSVANWVPLGPEGGAAAGLLIDAADPDRILLLSTTAGLFESTDGAMTFAPLAGTPRDSSAFAAPMRLAEIAQNPAAANIVLASALFGTRAGWRSTDGGNNWTPIESVELRGNPAFSSDGSRAYAGSTDGPMTSVDNGLSWSALTGAGAPPEFSLDSTIARTRIVPSPAIPDRVYMVRFGTIIRSDDGGANWQLLAPLPGGVRVDGLAMAGAPAEVLLAISRNLPGEILASLDNGASWTIEATGLLDTTGNPAQLEHLSVQASTGAMFALSEGRLHRSSGIGQPWTSANLPAVIDFPNGIHFDVQDSSRLFITALSGLFASTDGGTTWQARSAGFRGHSVEDLTTSRAEPGTIHATTFNTVFSTSDTGNTWTDFGPRTPLNDRARRPIASASDPLTLHAVSGLSTPMRTTDGGASWTLLPSPSDALNQFGLGLTLLVWSDPRNGSTLIAGEFGTQGIFDDVGMFQSTDGGNTWTRRFAPPADRLNFQPQSVADDPTRPGTVFFGIQARTEQAFTNGLVLRSTDGGATFDNLIDGFAFAEVAVDSVGTVFVGGHRLSIRQGVWRSTDGGDTWEDVNNGMPLGESIVEIAAHPSIPGRLVVSTSTDLYETRDNGASWQPMSRIGLGRGNAIRSIEILPGVGENLELMVGTDSGVFFSNQASLPDSIPVPTLRFGSLAILTLLMLFAGLLALSLLLGRPTHR